MSDLNLDFWALDLAPAGSSAFALLASGSGPVAGRLATLDAGAVRNGAYRLRLTATDVAGRTSRTEIPVEIDSAAKPGGFRREETDLTALLGGVPVAVARAYDSLDAAGGRDFGPGWRLAGRDADLQTSVGATGRESSGLYNPFRDGTRVYLTLPDGRRVGFTFAPVPHAQPGVTYLTPAFRADLGVAWRLDSAAAVLVRGGAGYYDALTARPYHPASGQFDGPEYTLTGPDGTAYALSTARGLERLTAPGGATLYFTDAGVTASTGESIRFVRDAAGRVAAAVGPDGTRIDYRYDARGALIAVRTEASGAATRYGYGAEGRLALAAAPGAGVAVTYAPTPVAVPLVADLGGAGDFLGRVTAGVLAAGATDRYSFTLRASELARTRDGVALVGVRVVGAGGLQPAAPVVPGFTRVAGRAAGGVAVALFALDRDGLLLLDVSGAGGAAGTDTVELFAAGDANADGAVDGLDGGLAVAALRAAAGQAGYLEGADADRSGAIDATDVQLLAANLGFGKNRAPSASAGAARSHADLAVAIDLAPLADDPDADALAFLLGGARHGNVRATGDGHTVEFLPDAGFAGEASFDYQADDGFGRSAAATVTVTVIGAALLDLDFRQRRPRLDPGASFTADAVPAGTVVGISPVAEATLRATPGGFPVAAAFRLDLGTAPLDQPVQLAVPVNLPAGAVVYFFQDGEYVTDDGTVRPIWWQVESGVVGADGVARTASPPYAGVKAGGTFFASNGLDVQLARFTATNDLHAASTMAAIAGFAGAVGGVVGLYGAAAAVSALGDYANLAMPSAPTPQRVDVLVIPRAGLPVTTAGNYQIDPGKVNDFAVTVLPPHNLPPDAPLDSGVKVALPGGRPEVVLTGTKFTPTGGSVTDGVVQFTMPGAFGQVLFGQVLPTSTAAELHVSIPEGVVTGLAEIVVTRPDKVPQLKGGQVVPVPSDHPPISNPVTIDPSGDYVFVALPEAESTGAGVAGALAVLDGNPDHRYANPAAPDASSPGDLGTLVARIPLGRPADNPYPRDVAVTPDNTRAYVTLRGAGRVAVVDAVALREVDVAAGRPNAPAATPAAIPAAGKARLDPTLYAAALADPLDVRGTVDLGDDARWTLDLVSVATGGVVARLGTGTGKVASAALTRFDPAPYENGFYKLHLEATRPNFTFAEDDSLVRFAAKPKVKQIELPFGATPYGIAIDPAGRFAYVAVGAAYLSQGEAASYVFGIDIEPASATFHQVTRRFPIGLGLAPTGLRNVAVSGDGLHVYATAPNANPDPDAAGAARFAQLPGKVIDIDLTALGTPGGAALITAIGAGRKTFGVTATPDGKGIAFTNAEDDSQGVVVRPAGSAGGPRRSGSTWRSTRPRPTTRASWPSATPAKSSSRRTASTRS